MLVLLNIHKHVYEIVVNISYKHLLNSMFFYKHILKSLLTFLCCCEIELVFAEVVTRLLVLLLKHKIPPERCCPQHQLT